MSQITQQKKPPKMELNETEATNLPETEFKTLIIKMLKEFSENFNKEITSIKKDIEAMKNNQTEIKNTITEMTNTLEGITSRLNEAEVRISDLEDKVAEFTQSEQQKEKRIKNNENSLRDLWDNIKCNNIRILGVPEGEERVRDRELI
ncbi:hypothetical protein mRhiFer1_008368 [Rhinolophus ferrumequinum]|uniref:L1 transposable element trimerization domain-containing protein n=1 Tax=Rhinolophus ferrumequinum TaxID=59479 RepID=A0A7J7VEE2_RHIFE|nr:hypothetical protein mRhiFer1_008368 [Rhinolophus ferrumequinum]